MLARMQDYRREWTIGGMRFFTVNLLERRRNDLLVTQFDRFTGLHRTRTIAPSILGRRRGGVPDHMHWIWRLPEGDADFATRWCRIKTDFSLRLQKSNDVRWYRLREANAAFDNAVIGNT